MSVTCYECVFFCRSYAAWKLLISCAPLYCHLWRGRLYHIFPHYLINGRIFGKRHWTENVFWFILQLLYKRLLILRRIYRDAITNIHRSSCKVHLILEYLMKLEFAGQIFFPSKNPQIWNYMKICPVGAELFHADGRRVLTKLRGSYRKSWATIFCKVTCFIIDKPNTPP